MKVPAGYTVDGRGIAVEVYSFPMEYYLSVAVRGGPNSAWIGWIGPR